MTVKMVAKFKMQLVLGSLVLILVKIIMFSNSFFTFVLPGCTIMLEKYE